MTPAESENRFDDLLRRKLADDEVQPSAGLWPAVSATLPPPRPRAGWAVSAAALLGVLFGLIAGLWLNPGASWESAPLRTTSALVRTVPAPVRTIDTQLRTVVPPVGTKTPPVRTAYAHVRTANALVRTDNAPVRRADTPVRTADTLVRTSSAAVRASDATVSAGLVNTMWATALAQDGAIRHEVATAVAPVQPDSASRLPALVAAQRATLRALQGQLDSLKAALPAEPAALAAAELVGPAAGPADSVLRPALAPLRRWSAALLTETTTPWGVLPGPADSRETIGGAASQSLQVEHRLANDRWGVRGGFGRVQLTGTFRHVAETTGQTMTSDTTTVTQLDAFTRVDTTTIIQTDSVPHLNPRINGGGQIIGYDTLWVANNDTLYQLLITHDTIRRTTAVVSTRLDTWRERREQQLRPTYRFWTIPVAAQVDVLRRGRWRAGLSVGAQVLIFRGGDQPARLSDGTYVLRRVSANAGPFRPVSVALTTGLEVRYRLTARLSLLAGAGGRGWVQSPVRGEARPRVQPTGQVGLSWGLGLGVR